MTSYNPDNATGAPSFILGCRPDLGGTVSRLVDDQIWEGKSPAEPLQFPQITARLGRTSPSRENEMALAHIGTSMVQGAHIGSAMIQGNDIGYELIVGNHIGYEAVVTDSGVLRKH